MILLMLFTILLFGIVTLGLLLGHIVTALLIDAGVLLLTICFLRKLLN